MVARSTPQSQWLAALNQPLALAGTTLPNRLMMSALTLQYGADGLISDRHLAFYRERGRGEVGLLLSEQLAASPLSQSPFARALRAYDERQIAGFRRIAATLKPFPTRFFAQLFSAGAAGGSTVGFSWGPLRGPSAIAAPNGETPQPLSQGEIDQIVHDYGVCARNVREGELHGVEVHGAHGWLVGQFLSPFYNKRPDRYGGSVANRCRFALEIGAAIRAQVGPDFPLGLSLTYDELLGNAGITAEDTLEQLRILDSAGLFDYFDLSVGSSHQQHYTIASMAVPQGFSLPFAARAKGVVRAGTAIFTSGRIIDVHMAGRAIAEGHADVVGMARALLADPYLLVKARADTRLSRSTTRCVGANYCVARALVDQPVACVLNPRTGREGEWAELKRSETPARITVIGAGPAGLTFAAVAARRGHQVTVLEREGQPGGHLALLARLPTREAWSEAVEDMAAALIDAGGRLELGVAAEAQSILEGTPEIVIVATGSRWLLPEGAAGVAGPAAMALDGAIETAAREGVTRFGRHVLLLDASGTYAPLGLADLLSAQGIGVTLVTPNEALGHVAAAELELQHVMPRLVARGVAAIVAHTVLEASGRTVILQSAWGDSRRVIGDVDCVVYAQARGSRAEIYSQLVTGHPRVHCIGDALSPRTTAAVIHEAASLGRTI